MSWPIVGSQLCSVRITDTEFNRVIPCPRAARRVQSDSARGCKVADSDLMRLAIRVCNSICRSNASASESTRSCKYELFAGTIPA